MYSPQYRKKRKTPKTEQEVHEKDHISNLPDEILLHILSLMHVRSAIRTSTLSKRWKSLAFNPPIKFSCSQQYPTLKDPCLWLDKIPPKPHHFSVHCIHCFKEAEALDKETDEAERFPYSDWKCQKLVLRSGKLFLSESFQGLKSVVSLQLDNVMTNIKVINLLISTCDLLENLEVVNCGFEEEQPKISVPDSSRLRRLEIIFGYRRLDWCEIDAPSHLFVSFDCSRYVLEKSWRNLHVDLDEWRRKLYGTTYVRILFATDWLFQVWRF